MDLYQGTINVETLGINNIQYIYLLENKYFAFYRNHMFIMNNTDTKIEYDLIFSENENTKKYISLEDNQHILYQEIVPNKSSTFFITNLDGSIYYHKNTIDVYFQIIKLWDTQRYYGYFSKNSLFLMTFTNDLYRQYDLNNINPIWASNFIFFNNSLWVLLSDKNSNFTLHSFSDTTYYSKQFTINFNNININNITISITEDNQLHIFIPTIDLKDLYHITKPISDFILSTFGNCIMYSEPANSLMLLLTNRNVFTKLSSDDSLNLLLKKNIEKTILQITLGNITQILKPFVPTEHVSIKSLQMNKPTSNIFYLKSDNPLDYIKWIIDNYDNYTYKQVIFYSQNIVNVYNYYFEKKIIVNIDLNIISQNYDNYCLLYNHAYLNDLFVYERIFKYCRNTYPMNSVNNDLDFYLKSPNFITYSNKAQIINIFNQLNINIKQLFWSPFLFYKFDIRYLHEHSIEYWKKALFILENSKDIDLKFLLYSIFFII